VFSVDALPVPAIITVGIEEFATGSEGEEIANTQMGVYLGEEVVG
jgi:hypothetical protein